MGQTLSKWLFFKLAGWTIVGDFPKDVKKYIIVVAPHTSGWDFLIGLLVRSIKQVEAYFIGKDSLFKPPLGWLFRALGGYPVDRSKRTNFVDSVVDLFNSKESFAIAIAPEGTRKRVEKLKTGFYYIALGAKIPIVLGKLDYEHKIVEIAEPMYLSGNIDHDFEKIVSFFRGVKGKYPENSVHL